MTEEPSGDILARGPVHKLTIEFELNRFRGELLPELDRLKELGVIRIIDLLAVRKDRTGAFMVMMASDLRPDEEAPKKMDERKSNAPLASNRRASRARSRRPPPCSA